MTRAKRHSRGNTQSIRLALLRQEQGRAIARADDVPGLIGWLREDLFAVAGPDHRTRGELFDFVVEQLERRQAVCRHRIGPVGRSLRNQRDDSRAFAAALDGQLAAVAKEYEVSTALVRAVSAVSAVDERSAVRWQRDTQLHRRLGSRYGGLQEAVADVACGTVRASAGIENLNSRLRGYFFLRRHLGEAYLELLRVFLNHRRFGRSEHPQRVGKSPSELLSGTSHPHWVELLGYHRFQRN